MKNRLEFDIDQAPPTAKELESAMKRENILCGMKFFGWFALCIALFASIFLFGIIVGQPEPQLIVAWILSVSGTLFIALRRLKHMENKRVVEDYLPFKRPHSLGEMVRAMRGTHHLQPDIQIKAWVIEDARVRAYTEAVYSQGRDLVAGEYKAIEDRIRIKRHERLDLAAAKKANKPKRVKLRIVRATGSSKSSHGGPA